MTTTRALLTLAATLGVSIGFPQEQQRRDPRRPETGRDRAARRRRAQAIAASTGYSVDEVYYALGAGRTEAQIVDARQRNMSASDVT